MVALQPSSCLYALYENIHPFPKMHVNTSLSSSKKVSNFVKETVQKVLAKYFINIPTDFT
jgi:hypothetical protein